MRAGDGQGVFLAKSWLHAAMAWSDGVGVRVPLHCEGLPLVAVIALSTSAHQSSLLAAAAVALVLLFALVAGVRLDRIGDALFSSQPICGVRSSCCWHRSLPGWASCGSSC